jgi:hypothetical protein
MKAKGMCEDCERRTAVCRVSGAALCRLCAEIERDYLKATAEQSRPAAGCSRCHVEGSRLNSRGLCPACEATPALPGLEPQPWDLRLENQESAPVLAASTERRAVQETLF